MYLKTLFNHKLFLTGMTIICFFLITSFLYTAILEDYIPLPYKYSHNEKGEVIDQAPFPISLEFPLGSDTTGTSLLYMVIDGAKFTILLCVGVGVARLVFGLIFGFLLLLLPSSIKLIVQGLFDGLHYIPLSLFTYMLAAPFFIFTWSFGEGSTIYGPLIIISLLSTPVLAIYLSDEIQRIYKKEFILNSKLMGGSSWHIFFTHIRPFFMPQLLIVLLQQIGQVLVLFAHLGILGLFIGGGERKEVDADIESGIPVFEVFSTSNEWGGLIAKYSSEFLTHPNLILGPVTCLALVVLALNFIVEGLKYVFIDEKFIEMRVKSNSKNVDNFPNPTQSPFTLLRGENIEQ